MFQIPKSITIFTKDSLVYIIINIINKAIPLVLLPVIIRLINSENFGLYSLFITVETLLLPLVSLNISTAISRHFYYDELNLKEYVSSIIISSLILLVVFLLLSLLITPNFISKFGLTNINIIQAIFCSGILGIVQFVSNLLRLQRNHWYYGLYIILQSVLLLIILLTFGILYRSSNMLIFARIFYYSTIFFITIIFLSKSKIISFSFNKKWVLKGLKLTLPTVIFSLSSIIFISSDRFLIQHFIGPRHVGYYSAIYQLASIISVISMSINAAWMPWLFENLKKNNYEINLMIVKVSYLIVLILIIIGITYCLLFEPIAKIILSKEYIYYIDISYPLIIGFVFQGIYFIISPYVFYTEKTKFNIYIGIVIALINVIFNSLMIPILGIKGAAFTNLITWVMLCLSFFVVSKKAYPMPWFNTLKKIYK